MELHPLLFNFVTPASNSSEGYSYSPKTGSKQNVGGPSKERSLSETLSRITVINLLATVVIAGLVSFFGLLASSWTQRTVTIDKGTKESPDSFPEEFDTSPDHFIGVNEAVKNKIKEVNGKSAEEIKEALGIEQSIDLGGHGGTFKGRIEVDGASHYLFLKPKDPVEYKNYQIIQRLAPEVAQFMPKVYGEIRIGEKSYLVMENTRIGQAGEALEQLVDIKLAGKVSGDPNFNPIANQDEMVATRGKKKNKLDYKYMLFYSTRLGDHIVITEGEKYERVFNYSKSEENLIKSLEGVSVDKLEGLIKDMEKLQKAMEECPVSFIGASIILVKDEMGNVKPILIDPAHIQVLSYEKERLPADLQEKTYFSDEGKYRVSNSIGMGQIIKVVTKMKKEKEEAPYNILEAAYNHFSQPSR